MSIAFHSRITCNNRTKDEGVSQENIKNLSIPNRFNGWKIKKSKNYKIISSPKIIIISSPNCLFIFQAK